MLDSKTARIKMKRMTELVDVINENGAVIETLPRNEVYARNLLHRCAFVLVLNSRGEILVTKRTASKDVYPSLYEIARGGTCAAGESFEECAKRELEEEVGVKNAQLEFLFDFDYKDDLVNERCRVFKCVWDGELRLQREEVESSFFASEKELRKMARERPSEFCPDNLPVLEKARRSKGLF